MKYNLFLYFRLAICTLIVPSTLFASNADQSQTLEQHIDKLCKELTQERLQLVSKIRSRKKKYRGYIQNKAFKDEFTFLSWFLEDIVKKDLDTPYTIDILKNTLKKDLPDRIKAKPQKYFIEYHDFNNDDEDHQEDVFSDGDINPLFLFIELYAGNVAPLLFLNTLANTNNKDWDYFKTKYLDPNREHQSAFDKLKANEVTTTTKALNSLTSNSAFIFIANNIVKEKDLSAEGFLNSIAKLKNNNRWTDTDNAPPPPINNQDNADNKQDENSDSFVHNLDWKIIGRSILSLIACGFALRKYYINKKETSQKENKASLEKKAQKG